MASYGSLVGGALAFAGVDQGIDFTGRGPVYALGDGVVTRAERSGSGWPGEGAILVYRLTSGPRAGQYVYVAEDFAIAGGLRAGSRVRAGQVIGYGTGSGRAPGIEVGWASSSGSPVAPLGPNKRASTGPGRDFQAFVSGGSSSSSSAVRTRPGGDTGGGITGAIAGLFHGAEGGVEGAIDSVIGLVSGPADFFKFLIALLEPRNWLRAIELLAGLGLLFVAIGGWLYLFGQSDDAPKSVKRAGSVAATVVTRGVVK